MGLFDVISLPGLLGVLRFGRQSDAERTMPIAVAIDVDPQAPPELVSAIKAAFMPGLASASVRVRRLARDMAPEARAADVALVLCGGQMGLCERAGQTWLSAGVPCLMVGRSSVEVPEAAITGHQAQRVMAQDPAQVLARIGHWIIDATAKRVAFAANFPFCRRAVASKLIHKVAAANTAVAAFDIIPGLLDFTVVTGNELKLALDIASVYDQKMTLARAPELVRVIALGFVTRAASGLVERHMPHLAWILRGAAGYGATWLVGSAMVARFEEAEYLNGVTLAALTKVNEAVDAAREGLGRLTGSIVKIGPDATYHHPKAQGRRPWLAGDVEDASPETFPGWVSID